MRKRAEVRDIELDPAIRLHYVEVEEPDMHNPSGDLERLNCGACREQWGLDGLECDLRVLQTLQKALRDGDWKVTVSVHRGAVLTNAWPGFVDRAYGLAVDVGSTTIAAHLCDLSTGEVIASSGIMNPQIRFGEDLMSRVSYVMMNPGGDKEMTKVVREAINDLDRARSPEEAGIAKSKRSSTPPSSAIRSCITCCSASIRPSSAAPPFALATNSGMTLWAEELDLHFHPNARAYILPCIAPTSPASSIATSSRRTSWFPPMAAASSSTSVWPAG